MDRREIRGTILELRIELEKNIRMLLDQFGLDSDFRTNKEILTLLKSQNIIDNEIYNLAFNLLQLGNKAAHYDVHVNDLHTAERLDERLHDLFKKRKLLFSNPKKKEPTFEELFEGRNHSNGKNGHQEKDFGELLDEYEADINNNKPGTDSKKSTKDKKHEHKHSKSKKENSDEDFEKLLEEYDFDPEDKDS